MELDEAKELLNLCMRVELRDHAFGDREISWYFMDVEVAGGYFGGGSARVWIDRYDPDPNAYHRETLCSFKDNDAYALVECGRLGAIERNDI